MTDNQIEELLRLAKKASLEAGRVILEVYNSADFDIEQKADDSPLTLADKKAHMIITHYLTPSQIPILSEEGKDIPYSERKDWEYLWIVDPLDGTKEFIKRNGEFTVNIALVHHNMPILGVVYAPVLDKLYWGGQTLDCQMQTFTETRSLSEPKSSFDKKKAGNRVIASRSHLNDETQEYLDKLNSPQIVNMGSSLKFMLLAEGLADVYPRFAPTMEWDTAAAHAILLGLGLAVNNLENKPLKYNKENLLNPYFCAH